MKQFFIFIILVCLISCGNKGTQANQDNQTQLVIEETNSDQCKVVTDFVIRIENDSIKGYYPNKSLAFKSQIFDINIEDLKKQFANSNGEILYIRDSLSPINGEWIFFDTIGSMVARGKYTDGYKTGTWHMNFGYFWADGLFKNGLKEGKWTFSMDYDSISYWFYTFKDGLRNGACEFYGDGSLGTFGNYKNNKREGKWKLCYEYCDSYCVGHYVNGLKHGLWKSYYDTRVTSEEHYINGKKSGIWKYYNEDGSLESVKNYNSKDDDEIEEEEEEDIRYTFEIPAHTSYFM